MYAERREYNIASQPEAAETTDSSVPFVFRCKRYTYQPESNVKLISERRTGIVPYMHTASSRLIFSTREPTYDPTLLNQELEQLLTATTPPDTEETTVFVRQVRHAEEHPEDQTLAFPQFTVEEMLPQQQMRILGHALNPDKDADEIKYLVFGTIYPIEELAELIDKFDQGMFRRENHEYNRAVEKLFARLRHGATKEQLEIIEKTYAFGIKHPTQKGESEKAGILALIHNMNIQESTKK